MGFGVKYPGFLAPMGYPNLNSGHKPLENQPPFLDTVLDCSRTRNCNVTESNTLSYICAAEDFKCKYGFHSLSQKNKICAPNSCKCSNGVGKTACDCPNEAINDCELCDLGYRLETDVQNSCVENECVCTNGDGQIGAAHGENCFFNLVGADGIGGKLDQCGKCKDLYHLEILKGVSLLVVNGSELYVQEGLSKHFSVKHPCAIFEEFYQARSLRDHEGTTESSSQNSDLPEISFDELNRLRIQCHESFSSCGLNLTIFQPEINTTFTPTVYPDIKTCLAESCQLIFNNSCVDCCEYSRGALNGGSAKWCTT